MKAGILKDHKGFSLIELIVSILIMSVIAGIVVILIMTSRNTYSIVSTDAVIQGEAETVRNFINEIAIEAHNFGQEAVGSDKCIWFLAPDNDPAPSATSVEYYYYFILHETATGTLRYGKLECADIASDRIKVNVGGTVKTVGVDCSLEDLLSADGSSTKIKGDAYKLLAQHISTINCQSKSVESGINEGLITVDLTLAYNDVSDYRKTFIFAGRNMK